MGVAIEYLHKAFDLVDGEPNFVLEDVNLAVQDGEFICILGKSGCGKSTLLNMLAGYLKPDKGRIVVNGQEIDGPSAERGVVFQQHALFPWYTVRENIEFGLHLQKRKDAGETATKLIEMIGLQDYEKAYPTELSGGMAQRVGIARALAPDPAVLLMDEPLGALDALTRESMRQELTRIWQLSGKTIFFITHSVPEAVYLADRVVILKDGQVEADVPIKLPRPRNMRDKEFLEYVDDFARMIAETEDEERAVCAE
ncbi:putative ABC transporter ATP-binding protein [Selenomonas ruminantium subsp. lactilytica TAM6421]|uniref:Putative ABC transporter ATP-binding protein n=1 Tax=Selenomonas ruminantium subsp. lactilytica (strain NBRC 103574 / TAM6421) TaxID=927704 RepID=I0GU28_SELRL|nr:ABC transporter ATP-binding protein [Selenomonas ruminantium]BAL84265.1 putative ABC transporter ATP-binding protein [Selenomonas ruminantium subsp. lactilytica TAM6421]